MSKAILVMDMPKGCCDCQFMRPIEMMDGDMYCVANASILRLIEIDNYTRLDKECPLKEIPHFLTTTEVGFTDAMINMGWNACLKKILGDENEQNERTS